MIMLHTAWPFNERVSIILGFNYLTKTTGAFLRDKRSPHLFAESVLIQASVYMPESHLREEQH